MVTNLKLSDLSETARNCAIVALMLDSGLRQGEVCDLLTENIYFHKAMLKVRGKGDKERIVPLGKIAMLYMKNIQNYALSIVNTFSCPAVGKLLLVIL